MFVSIHKTKPKKKKKVKKYFEWRQIMWIGKIIIMNLIQGYEKEEKKINST